MASVNNNNFKKIQKEFKNIQKEFKAIKTEYGGLEDVGDIVCVEGYISSFDSLEPLAKKLMTKIENTLDAVSDLKVENKYKKMLEDLKDIHDYCHYNSEDLKQFLETCQYERYERR